MGEAYEFDGQMFTNSGEFLDAVAHEYRNGDRDLALQTLEDYGFSTSDINVVPTSPHPISADDDADPEPDDDEEDDAYDDEEDKEEE